MIWKDKVRGEKIGETIQTASYELFRGEFDEIKELDEEYIYTSGLHSGDNTDRLMSDPQGPMARKLEATAIDSRQNTNYHFNIHLNSSDVDDDKPQLILSDIYDKSLVKSDHEPYISYGEIGNFSAEKIALQSTHQPASHPKIPTISKNVLQLTNPLPSDPNAARGSEVIRKLTKQLKSHQYIQCLTIPDESEHNISVKAHSEDRPKKDSASLERHSRKLKKLNSNEKKRTYRLKSDPKFIFTFSDNLKLANLHHTGIMKSKLANSLKSEGGQNTHVENQFSRLSFFKSINENNQKKNTGSPETLNRGKLQQQKLARFSEDKSLSKMNSSVTNVFAKVQELVRRPMLDAKPKTTSYRSLKKNSFLN